MIEIEESGMLFRFEDDMIFKIENSELHKSAGDGIKSVEFVVEFKNNEIYFVEAKSSSPKPIKKNKEKNEKDEFEEFIEKISEKFIHSFDLYLSAILKINENLELSNKFKENDYSKVKFKFILIIKGHKREWLLAIRDSLEFKLKYHRKIWKTTCIVMNEEVAIEKGLVNNVI